MNEVHCIHCHGLFECKRSDALTCGPKCRQAEKRARDRSVKRMEKRREDWSPQERQAIIDGAMDAKKARE